MAQTLSGLVGAWPWWAWLLVAAAGFFGFTLAWATALATLSAYGAHYRVLTSRQRRLGRGVSLLSLLSVPVFAIAGLAGLAAAAWRWIE